MKDRLYETNRSEVFKDCGLRTRDKSHSCHHDYFKRDIKNNLIPRNFPISSRCNLTPLPNDTHEELHYIIDSNPYYRNNISLRVYFANMAYNEELDLIPDRMYRSSPKDLMKK